MRGEALVPGFTEEDMIRLIDTYSGILLGVCTLMLSDRYMAQDVVQETFLKAWKHRHIPKSNEKAWLLKVAVNLCHDVHRSRWWKHIDQRVPPEELPIPAPEASNLEIIDLVRHLPVREREVVILHYWNNMSAEDIADTLNISRAAVYRHLEKAKKLLRLEMEGG